MKASYLARTRHAQQVTAEALHILQQSAFLMCSLSLIMLSALNSEKHMLETEQPQFYILGCCSWIPTLCPSACALSSLWWVPSVKRPTKRITWRFALDHVNYEMSNFQLAQLLLPWSICCVETKTEEKAWRPLWTTDPKLQESCYERIRCTCKQVCRERGKCFKAACCAQPCAYATRQGFLTGKGQLR